jgi:benzylsuccinate CoA-transferase BbsF subunit
LGPYKDGTAGVNKTAFFARYNTNKYSVTLNLNHPKGPEIAKRFIQWADIVGESFTPGVMRRWGLAYEDIVKIKPDIIMFSTTNQGQTGPHATYHGYGVQLTALAGFTHLTGWTDREAAGISGAYTDLISPRLLVTALVAALDYKRRTGKGQYLDFSQFEGSLHFLTPVFLDYLVNNRVWNRKGNRHPYAVPHGVFRCKGEDKWCAIAVFTDGEWKALCKALGNPPWTKDPKFSTFLNRKQNEDELEALIEEWTCQHTPEEVMTLLQKHGVPAGVVNSNQDLYNDPQLKHRNQFIELSHPEIGVYPVENQAYILSKTPAELSPAPCLGEHNYYVYTQLLGMPEQEFLQLLQEGVLE